MNRVGPPSFDRETNVTPRALIPGGCDCIGRNCQQIQCEIVDVDGTADELHVEIVVARCEVHVR